MRCQAGKEAEARQGGLLDGQYRPAHDLRNECLPAFSAMGLGILFRPCQSGYLCYRWLSRVA